MNIFFGRLNLRIFALLLPLGFQPHANASYTHLPTACPVDARYAGGGFHAGTWTSAAHSQSGRGELTVTANNPNNPAEQQPWAGTLYCPALTSQTDCRSFLNTIRIAADYLPCYQSGHHNIAGTSLAVCTNQLGGPCGMTRTPYTPSTGDNPYTKTWGPILRLCVSTEDCYALKPLSP